MRFHGILVVRDEEDIIDQSLSHFTDWCDNIYIYDTGSVDNTWEIVSEYSSETDEIIAFRKKNVIFEDWIRGIVFDRYRHKSSKGDWWIRLDADEFYHIPPPDFVRKHVDSHESLIFNQTYEFHLTEDDVEAWKQGAESISDRRKPIEDRRRYYVPLEYAEPRMFQYRPSMKWPASAVFPFYSGFPAQKRIPIRHYPHRDPLQLKKRTILRSVGARVRDDMDVKHWKINDWHELVVNKDKQNLQYWEPNSDLPELNWKNHMPNELRKFAMRIVYSGPVQIMDKFRSGFDESKTATKFPSDAQEEIVQAYNKIEKEEK
jgi:glycosyltransferase involved in cell wall biosynthesis